MFSLTFSPSYFSLTFSPSYFSLTFHFSLTFSAVGIWKEKGDTPGTNFLFAEVNGRLEKIEGTGGAGAGAGAGGGAVGADGKGRCAIM